MWTWWMWEERSPPVEVESGGAGLEETSRVGKGPRRGATGMTARVGFGRIAKPCTPGRAHLALHALVLQFLLLSALLGIAYEALTTLAFS